MDFGSTEVSAARQRAVADIRQRVAENVASWLSDTECVELALAASTREPAELLGFLFKPQLARAAAPKLKLLAITLDEWAALFGSTARPTKTTLLERVLQEDKFVSSVKTLQNALRCTIGEEAQGSTWSRAWTKASCYVGMHSETHEECIAVCLGNVVRADSRRLEELRVIIDDDGLETMLLGQMLSALADSVT